MVLRGRGRAHFFIFHLFHHSCFSTAWIKAAFGVRLIAAPGCRRASAGPAKGTEPAAAATAHPGRWHTHTPARSSTSASLVQGAGRLRPGLAGGRGGGGGAGGRRLLGDAGRGLGWGLG
jgi:hypothetical protein